MTYLAKDAVPTPQPTENPALIWTAASIALQTRAGVRVRESESRLSIPTSYSHTRTPNGAQLPDLSNQRRERAKYHTTRDMRGKRWVKTNNKQASKKQSITLPKFIGVEICPHHQRIHQTKQKQSRHSTPREPCRHRCRRRRSGREKERQKTVLPPLSFPFGCKVRMR